MGNMHNSFAHFIPLQRQLCTPTSLLPPQALWLPVARPPVAHLSQALDGRQAGILSKRQGDSVQRICKSLHGILLQAGLLLCSCLHSIMQSRLPCSLQMG